MVLVRTSGHDGFQIDDGGGEGCAIKGLASDLDRRKENLAHRGQRCARRGSH